MTSIATYDYDEMRRRECEQLIPQVFHVYLPVDRFVCDDIQIGPDSYAMLFESDKNLYALLIDNQKGQTLADVKRLTKQIGLQVSRYFPPGADPRYFFDSGMRLYQRYFPAKRTWSRQDIDFYAQQAIYSPALVRVSAVDNGLRRFIPGVNSWQHASDFTFKKVQVV